MTTTEILGFRTAHATLCECCKVDIPEAEAVIALVTPQLAGLWVGIVDEAVEVAERELRFGTTADQIVAILVNLVLERVRFGIPSRLATAIEEGTFSVVGSAQRRLNLPPAGGVAGALTPIARADVETLLRGRVESRLPEMTRVLGRAPARRLRGVPAPRDRQEVPAEVRRLRIALGDVLGRNTRGWLDATVDLWAYRWFNLGGFAVGRAAGVVAWEARAVRDTRTTKFCSWVDRRVVALEKLERQFDRFTNAALRGDSDALRSAWPVLLEPNMGDAETWSEFFERADVGFPPYHFRCRTTVRPVRIRRR